MYSSLIDAPINAELTIMKIVNVDLITWMNHLGLFVGSKVTRHDDEINFNPVRVRGGIGDVIVPAGLGIKAIVHLQNGERKPLTEMDKKDTGHLESIAGGRGCEKALNRLGLKIDSEITFLRSLPHMDYIVLINQTQRTRISEGEASRIWGSVEDGVEGQFYFSKRGASFTITEILGGRGVGQHLATHGIAIGNSMVLEGIEQAQQAHAPAEKKVTVSSQSGLRMYLNLKQAGQIVVESEETTHPGETTAPQDY